MTAYSSVQMVLIGKVISYRRITLDKTLESASFVKNAKKSFMTVSALLHKRKTLLLVILFIAFSAFTADILDLREEIHLLAYQDSSLDNNVTTGIISKIVFALETVVLFSTVDLNLSVIISFLHLLPCGFRAPPGLS
jgi:hypothetical protein